MIHPLVAVSVILVVLVLLGVLVPILDAKEKYSKYISLRWTVVVVFLAVFIGVVINFNELDKDVKWLICISTAIISGVYIVLRSLEKWMCNGWKLGVKVEAEKDGWKFKASPVESKALNELKEKEEILKS